MEITPLPWDTNFFNLQIARIDVVAPLVEKSLLQLIEQAKEYDLFYIFLPGEEFLELSNCGDRCALVDRKVLFSMDIPPFVEANSFEKSFRIEEYGSKHVHPDLEQLAYQSGEYSRFRRDANFQSDDFYRMYYSWLKKSINGEIAQIVLTAWQSERVVGFITAAIQQEKATIGLFAVDSETRGMGVGTSLFNSLLQVVKNKGVARVDVNTQMDNKSACDFYQKVGFKKEHITNIYHYWRR